jgi:glucokinase
MAITGDARRAAEFGNKVASSRHHETRHRHRQPGGDPRPVNILAIDIGGTKFQAAAFADGTMVRREMRMTDREGGRVALLDSLGPLIREWHSELHFERCGIGFEAPSTGPPRWSSPPPTSAAGRISDFVGWVREQLGGIPVVMDNDANVGALGEYLYGAGRDCNPLLYVTVSTGNGGGILIDGKILRGADSFAGEIGHVNVLPDGPPCLCGSNGCQERMCGGLWLERDYGKTAKELLQDPAFVEKYVVNLARGLKAATMLLNPARIIIGGGISEAGDALFQPLRADSSARQMPPWSKARQDIQPAQLADEQRPLRRPRTGPPSGITKWQIR